MYLFQEDYIDAIVCNFLHLIPESVSVITPILENLELLTTEEETLTIKQSRFVITFLIDSSLVQTYM